MRLKAGQKNIGAYSWLPFEYLESSGTPVHKLYRSLVLDGGDGAVDVLGHHVATVQHAAGHVLACQQELNNVPE